MATHTPLQITGQTRLVGVMGWPVAHSLSPEMHNAAFAALGIDNVYVPLAVAPERLGQAVAGLWALGFVGCNVTVPHKLAVQQYMETISDEARAVGAVNTLVRAPDADPARMAWMGYNSDVSGFLMSLAEEGFAPQDQRVLVLGAGGAARGVVYGLARAGATVAILNRTTARGEALAREMSGAVPGAALEAGPLTAERLQREAERSTLLVNTTTLGMWPHADGSPWPEELPFPPHLTAFDLVYNPLRTRLMAQAAAAGAKTISGLKMLVYQGAVSFNWWFGIMPPADVMYQVCYDKLSRR